MHDPDPVEVDRGPKAIWEAAPPTQSYEDQISALSCPFSNKNKEFAEQFMKINPLVSLKGAVMLYSFNFYQAGTTGTMQSK